MASGIGGNTSDPCPSPASAVANTRCTCCARKITCGERRDDTPRREHRPRRDMRRAPVMALELAHPHDLAPLGLGDHAEAGRAVVPLARREHARLTCHSLEKARDKDGAPVLAKLVVDGTVRPMRTQTIDDVIRVRGEGESTLRRAAHTWPAAPRLTWPRSSPPPAGAV